MAFKFEELNVWHKALNLSINVNQLVATFPSFELYSLCSQMRRASDSVVLNIAEGSTGQSNAEFAKFLNYALRSAVEVVACLFIAKKKCYLEENSFQVFYDEYEHLSRMLTKLRDSLKIEKS
jgi:four helix bundle protein